MSIEIEVKVKSDDQSITITPSSLAFQVHNEGDSAFLASENPGEDNPHKYFWLNDMNPAAIKELGIACGLVTAAKELLDEQTCEI